jgi:hypothetical protein
VWYKVFEDLNMEAQSPSHTDQLAHWWRFERGNLEKSKRKGFDSIVMLVYWNLWVFGNTQRQYGASVLSRFIVEEAKQWQIAGARGLDIYVI